MTQYKDPTSQAGEPQRQNRDKDNVKPIVNLTPFQVLQNNLHYGKSKAKNAKFTLKKLREISLKNAPR